MSEKPIINCHTHIFTGRHVPPFLAKQFLIWPLYYLVSVKWIIAIGRFWFITLYDFRRKKWLKTFNKIRYISVIWIKRWLFPVAFAIECWIAVYAAIIVAILLDELFKGDGGNTGKIRDVIEWLENTGLYNFSITAGWKVLICIIFFICFPASRNLVLKLLGVVWKGIRIIPGKTSRALLNRYMNLGRFAFYNNQKDIFEKLAAQYPKDTKFVVLPMDMEYMNAGGLTEDYYTQIRALAKLSKSPTYKDQVIPFLGIDPRRIKGDEKFLRHSFADGKVTLNDCFVKEMMEDNGFVGLKIYPALGYFPFDENLLVLWKYAADRAIPITTHCIRGTIFYRGRKKKEWDFHEIFEQVMNAGEYEPLLLPEIKNVDFANNFTHPLNYLCLLHEPLLRKVVGKSTIQDNKDLFGYVDDNTPLKYDLSHLKICFAHFGGDDEWARFQEQDRDNYGNALISTPDFGINFFADRKGNPRPGKLEQLWKDADWYSIICSMMIQYENVYSDISYISHDEKIYALLKRSLETGNAKLRTRILFGTDFYVVRNHKSEKNILIDTVAGLSAKEFDLIARENPITFLTIQPVSKTS